jgi:hypothetical protein
MPNKAQTKRIQSEAIIPPEVYGGEALEYEMGRGILTEPSAEFLLWVAKRNKGE